MFYPIEVNQSKLSLKSDEIQRLTFKGLGLKESDIEEFLIDNLDLLVDGEDNLLVVGQQVRNVQNGRSDLVAVDKFGNLVLIEIKRDLDDMRNRKEPMEFQAIRYAATIAKIESLDILVSKIYAPYLERRGEIQGELTALEQAKRKLMNFLESNDSERTFNKKQRIILVASEYDEQTLSACAWLSNNNVDISCFTIEPRRYQQQLFLDVTKVLPLAKSEDFFVDVAVSRGNQAVKTNTSTKRYLPRMHQLIEWGIISQDDTIFIKNAQDSEAKVIDESTVSYQGVNMTYNEWGKKVTGWSAMSVYEWIIVKGQTETLHELRMKKMEEQEEKQ